MKYQEYIITYGNGTQQSKFLIPDSEWDVKFKPSRDLLAKYKGSKSLPDGITPEIIKQAEETLKKLPDLYFVESSPLGLGMQIGELVLPTQQGGIHKGIKFEIVKK